MIYLDYNATTPVAPEVLEAMLPFLRESYGNPSSSHAAGRRAHDAIEAARWQLAGLIGAEAGEIVFTSGGTEATNMALRGVVLAQPRRRHIVTSSFEHPATAETCGLLERQGLRVTRVPVASDGRVRVEEVDRALGDEPALVTVMHANNEIGTIQPIAAISRLAKAKGAVVHTDAAQTLGKIPLDVDALGVDLLTIAGHKLYAPKGIGALYIRCGTVLEKLLAGAGHERGLRPGTENVAGIVALGKACEIAERDLTCLQMELRGLRNDLLAKLQAGVAGLVLHGHPTERLPNTLFLSFPGVHGARLLEAVPEIAASTGSACHSGSIDACASLLAMGVDPGKAIGPVRLSLGRDTTVRDVEQAAELLIAAWKRLRAGSALARVASAP
ncbi:MAG TPA: cysteine desulfurase family protein [Burkholderiales bacterium]|nr:cysteine desulfurase family protein [Burkholderiales bacterium]